MFSTRAKYLKESETDKYCSQIFSSEIILSWENGSRWGSFWRILVMQGFFKSLTHSALMHVYTPGSHQASWPIEHGQGMTRPRLKNLQREGFIIFSLIQRFHCNVGNDIHGGKIGETGCFQTLNTFRSERPISPIFLSHIMSNGTWEREKELWFPPFNVHNFPIICFARAPRKCMCVPQEHWKISETFCEQPLFLYLGN